MNSMNGSEDWRELCELASKEMDSDKLLDLITKINSALDEHNQRSKYGPIRSTRLLASTERQFNPAVKDIPAFRPAARQKISRRGHSYPS
jgi:hypothetical protein